jgi:hypothetical protein
MAEPTYVDLDQTGAEIQAILTRAENQREVLTADRTYYVATTGSDSNDGLSSGSPFATIQKAVDVVCSLDLSIYQATIQLADGTYTAGATLKQYVGALPPIIQGNTTTPANVVVNVSTRRDALNGNADLPPTQSAHRARGDQAGARPLQTVQHALLCGRALDGRAWSRDAVDVGGYSGQRKGSKRKHLEPNGLETMSHDFVNRGTFIVLPVSRVVKRYGAGASSPPCSANSISR